MTPSARGHLAMLLFSALVAGSFSLGALAANEIAPAALNAVRFLIAGVVIGAVAWATTGIPREAVKAPWRYLVLGGLFAAYFVLMFEGLKTAVPVSAAAVFTLTPIMSAGFGYLLLRQITTPRMALGLSIGAVGALWVIFRADWQIFRSGRGPVFLGLCLACDLYTNGAQTKSWRSAGCVHLRDAGCRLYYTDGLWLERYSRHGLGRSSRNCVDHGGVSRDFCIGGHICAFAICHVEPAQCQGDGLYLSGTQLGHLLGDRTGPWRTDRSHSCWCRNDSGGPVAFAQK